MNNMNESINLDKIELGEGRYLHLTFSDGEVVRLGMDEHGRQRARRMMTNNELNISQKHRNELISTFGLDDFGFQIIDEDTDALFEAKYSDELAQQILDFEFEYIPYETEFETIEDVKKVLSRSAKRNNLIYNYQEIAKELESDEDSADLYQMIKNILAQLNPLKEDIDLEYESDFNDRDVYPGLKFIEDGKEWTYTVGYDQIYIDFDHWQIWEARNIDNDEMAFFIVDPDTGFIDWGPVETYEEASEFLYSKQDDWMDDDAEELEAIYNDNDLDTAAELLINHDDIV